MAYDNRTDHRSILTPAALGLQRHSPFAVASLIHDTLKDELAVLSISRLQDWMYKGFASIDVPNGRGTREVLEWLEEGKVLMSRELFCGGLDDISLDWEEGLLSREKALGYTQRIGTYIKIRLEPQLSDHRAVDDITSLTWFTTTLLHELGHAMLCRYSCQNACSDPGCRSLREDDTGPTYHGQAWQAIKRAIEKAWEERVGFEVDLE